MADGLDYCAAYSLMTAVELSTLKTAVLAEMNRQLLAGGNFGTGGKNRSGVSYAVLEKQLLAINAAQSAQAGGIIDMTVADLS